MTATDASTIEYGSQEGVYYSMIANKGWIAVNYLALFCCL